MKKYIKPTFQFVELRAEERLAACTGYVNKNKGLKCARNRLS